MKPWLRRTLYLLLFTLWLLILALPALAFILAARGEIRLGDDPQRSVRIFLVSEEEGSGVGFARARPVSAAPFCVENSVRYLMWRGQGESAASCQCYSDSSAGSLVSTTPGRCGP